MLPKHKKELCVKLIKEQAKLLNAYNKERFKADKKNRSCND